MKVIRSPTVKARMRPLAIVEPEISAKRFPPYLSHTLVGTKIHLLVLHRTSEPLDEHIVAPSPAPIHPDPDHILLRPSSERPSGGLAALVGVEGLQRAMAGQRHIDRVEAETDIHRDRHPPSRHPPTEPVHHCGQVHDAMCNHGEDNTRVAAQPPYRSGDRQNLCRSVYGGMGPATTGGKRRTSGSNGRTGTRLTPDRATRGCNYGRHSRSRRT